MDGPKVPSVHSGKQRYLMFFPQISQPSNWETARGSFCCDYSLWRSETRTQVKPSVIKTQRKLSETIIAKANASFLINRHGKIKPFNALLPISVHYWSDLHKHLQKQFCFKFVSKYKSRTLTELLFPLPKDDIWGNDCEFGSIWAQGNTGFLFLIGMDILKGGGAGAQI